MKPLQLRVQTQLGQPKGAKPKIDRKNLIMYGVSAITTGEALGHRLWVDETSLRMMADLGNAAPKGVKGQFGHIGLSEQAMGRQIQVARNFEVVGNQVLHEAHLLEAARKSPAFAQDPIEYILQMAERHPDQLGESLVFNTSAMWVLESGEEVDAFTEDGSRAKRPEKAKFKYPSIRPVALYFVDFVSDPAANANGLFEALSGSANADSGSSTGGGTILFNTGASAYLERAFAFVDEWRLRHDIPLSSLEAKLGQVLTAYKLSRTSGSGSGNRSNRSDRAGVGAGGVSNFSTKGEASVMDPNENSEVVDFSSLENEEGQTQGQTQGQVQGNVPLGPPALGEAEALIASLATPPVEASATTDEPENEGSIIPQLWARLQALEEQTARLSSALKQLAEVNVNLAAKVKTFEGEPFKNAKVPAVPQQRFSANANFATMTAPGQVTTPAKLQAKASGKPAPAVDPNSALGVMQAQTARARELGGPSALSVGSEA